MENMLNMNSSTCEAIEQLSKSQIMHLRESPAAKEHRLKRNAERMREKRASESYEEYQKRLEKNAFNNRLNRSRETTDEKAIRQLRDAARQRLRRAMESQDQRANRLQKLAERMRVVRRNETEEKKVERLSRAAHRARERLRYETSEERKVRLQKSLEYSKRVRYGKTNSNSISETESNVSDMLEQKPFIINLGINVCESISNNDNMNMQQFQVLNYLQHSVHPIPRVSVKVEAINRPIVTKLRIPQSKQFTSMSLLKGPQQRVDSSANLNIAENAVSKVRKKSVKDFNAEDQNRVERLRAIAEKSRMRRQNETQAQRDKRLSDLKDRARRRREIVKSNETEAERKERLAKQAEYARFRRKKLHEIKEKNQNIHEIIQTQTHINDIEAPSALKILEPIIEMNPFT